MYAEEKDMYPHVRAWLDRVLKSKFKDAKVRVGDTSKKVLSRWLFEHEYHKLFPEYSTYEIEVDVTGVIEKESSASLAFVECKLKKITLRDLSQLLGYSKVANPVISLIVSPAGVSDSLNLLFNVNRREDILTYNSGSKILIGRWDAPKKELDPSSTIPKGSHL